MKCGSSVTLDEKCSKRRVFGNEITNTVVNRSNLDEKENIKQRGSNVRSELSREQNQSIASKAFVFGPFAPPCVTETCRNSAEKQIQDWDKLSCVNQPQYRNQGKFFYHILAFFLLLRALWTENDRI